MSWNSLMSYCCYFWDGVGVGWGGGGIWFQALSGRDQSPWMVGQGRFCHHQNYSALRWAVVLPLFQFDRMWRAKTQYIYCPSITTAINSCEEAGYIYIFIMCFQERQVCWIIWELSCGSRSNSTPRVASRSGSSTTCTGTWESIALHDMSDCTTLHCFMCVCFMCVSVCVCFMCVCVCVCFLCVCACVCVLCVCVVCECVCVNYVN